MRNTCTRLARGLAQAAERVATLILIAVVAINLGQVVGRYLLMAPIPWAEEAMRYLMIWLMMAGGIACLYRGEHMAIELVQNLVRPDRRTLVRNLLYGVCILFCANLIWFGWPLAIRNAAQVAPASGIPMVVPYIALPIGGVLMIVQIVLGYIGGHAPEHAPEDDHAY